VFHGTFSTNRLYHATEVGNTAANSGLVQSWPGHHRQWCKKNSDQLFTWMVHFSSTSCGSTHTDHM